jgi:N-acetylmuramoyl-L-alanine amidase
MAKKIYIDAGHGGKDPGAVSGDFIEKDINLAVANHLARLLKDYDVGIYQNRTGDTKTSINDMCEAAKKAKVNLYISIHHNAGGGSGHEVFYQYDHEASKKFAKILDEEYKRVPQKSRGIKESKPGTSYNFGVCRINAASGIPAVLSEFAFVDSPVDQKMIDSDGKLLKEAQAVCKAVVSFLGLKKKPAPSPVPSQMFNERDIVNIKLSAERWLTGTKIPPWVKVKTWIVALVDGDRVVINNDTTGNYSINSPIKASDLMLVKKGEGPFLVKINVDLLNVRAGAGTNYKINQSVKRGEVFTIVEVSGFWGKLKSGAGWIYLPYTVRL